MARRAAFSLGALLLASFIASSSYADCRLGVDLAGASDRDLLYSLDGRSWQTFSGFAQLDPMPSARPISFLYVMRTDPTSPRAGALVIKYGRLVSAGAPTTGPQETVHLVRNEAAARFTNTCSIYQGRANKPFPLAGRRVPAKSYDDYHDYSGRQPPELAILRAYHVNYAASGGCRSTDDPYNGDRIRSNRSQFSYQAAVVTGGQYSGLGDFFFGTALADTGMSERRTEIRRYRIPADGLACVRFQFAVARPGNFLRINDLDVRRGPLALRIPEKEWR
ncbi:hypothetical protein ACVJGD_004799 [Bradyrhizobium sp. USDA 10063]